MTTWRRHWRRLRRIVLYGLGMLVILLGVVVATASQLLPLVREHPREIADWLSRRSGKVVNFQLGDAVWTRRGPLITLDGLRIGEGKGAIEVGRAQLLVSVYSGMLPGRPLTELHIRDLDLQLRQSEDGRWSLGGFGDSSGAAGNGLRSLQGLGEIRLESARLTVDSAVSGIHYVLDRVDARLLALGGRVRFGVSAWRDEQSPLRIAGDFDAELTAGDVYVGGKGLDLAPWFSGVVAAGIALAAGKGEFGGWARVDDRRVVDVRVSANLESLAFHGSDSLSLDGGEIEPRSGLERLQLTSHWQLRDDGWLLEVPRLRIEDGGREFAIDALRLRNQAEQNRAEQNRAERWSAQAERIDLQPLLSLAMLSSQLSPRLREWLYVAIPSARVDGLILRCDASSRCSGQATINDIQLARLRRIPGVDGLSGRLDFDADGGRFRFGNGRFDFDARGLFRGAQRLQADGELVFWRSSAGWRIGSDGLDIVADDFAVRGKGWIELQSDGSRPRVEIFAETAPGPLSAAGQFWVPSKMPEKVIRWLDQALVQGRTGKGRLLLHGDFDQWPFRSPEQGRFEADVELDDVTLDYLPGDWPRAEHLSGMARFLNEGMSVTGKAEIAGVAVTRVSGSIDDFRNARLMLAIAGEGSGGRLLNLLHQSPLQRSYAEPMRGLSIGGHGAVAVNIDLPFKAGLGKRQVKGSVDLRQADLASTQWGLAFGAANGRVEFSDAGFLAPELRVNYRDQPASLGIAVGGFTSSPDLAVEASLRGRLDVDGLLAEEESTLWLQPYLDGAADMSLLLGVAADRAASTDDSGKPIPPVPGETRLRLRSDLVGVEIQLPAPLKKAASARMPLDLDLDLPLTRLDLRLGRLMHLRSRHSAAGGMAGTAVFGGADAPAADAVEGLNVTGSVAVLDAVGWVMLATGEGDSVGLRHVVLDTGQLHLLGRSFADTRLELAVDDAGDASTITFSGDSLDGQVEVPGAAMTTRGITGRFARLYWPSAEVAQSTAALSSTPPSLLPPLHFSIEDFRFGEARLGVGRLETYPTPEGLHVEQFETRSDDLSLNASGDWRLIDGVEHSSFNLRFTSERVDNMLKSLGFSSMLEGGQTLVQLNGGWAGSPSAFALAKLRGNLRVSIGEGRIPDVKPGAGRLLGLVSLTEIPRRLTLDFSDFFQQGFSFNGIEGEFHLDGGNATTDDLHIDSPAADIHISGRTGLVAKDYDQRMEVLPRTSSVLPVVGAFAGGPAGAAIGAVAQAMFQRPMKQMARTLYRVSGSWDEPRIDVLEKGPARNGDPRLDQAPTAEPTGLPSTSHPQATDAADAADEAEPTEAVTTSPDPTGRVDGGREPPSGN